LHDEIDNEMACNVSTAASKRVSTRSGIAWQQIFVRATQHCVSGRKTECNLRFAIPCLLAGLMHTKDDDDDRPIE